MKVESAMLTFLDDGTSRVSREGDDIVIRAGGARLRVSRDRLLGCSPMLGRFHRERNAPEFPTEHLEDIVVELRLEGEPTRWLGPFEHSSGIALGRAIERARCDALVATPGFVVTVARDDASLVVDVGAGLSIPVPTTFLVRLRATSTLPAARYVLPTGITADTQIRYVEIIFAGAVSWAIGPLPVVLAEQLVTGFDAWRSAHPIDQAPVDVGMKELEADPVRWHGRRIRVVGWWSYGFERSSFGPAWLSGREPPEGDGNYRVRVVGTWIYPDATAAGGYGHLGGCPGSFEAESVEILEARPWSPTGAQDGLTSLLTRGAWLARVETTLSERSSCIAFLDLDHFKRVNDDHGHRVGDDLLRAWARIVVEVVGDRGIIGRWGADEIVVLFSVIEIDGVARLVEDVLAKVRTLSVPAGASSVTVTCSAGLTNGAKGEASRDVIARCDSALHEAKRAGYDRVVRCDEL